MTRTLSDPGSRRVYELTDGVLRQVSPFPVDHGTVQRLILADLIGGQLKARVPQACLAQRQSIRRLNQLLADETSRAAGAA